ncbi:MAG: hypothetical protein ACD_12C00234G0001 [uncultured bacterium]|nr:MAG: hypothetical protein ACD_12C00234G0001 [uncultured bacterium]
MNKTIALNKDYLNLLVIWFLISFALIHFDFLRHPRRLALGLQIPISLLSVIFFMYMLDFVRTKSRSMMTFLLRAPKIIFPIFFILFFGFSGLVIIITDIREFTLANKTLYLSQPVYEGMEYLGHLDDRAVLSGIYSGNLIPGNIGKTVYIGHDPETAFYDQKKEKIEWFFKDNENDPLRRDFLLTNNIGYLFWSDEEKSYGNFLPEKTNFLKAIYRNREVVIYEVM